MGTNGLFYFLFYEDEYRKILLLFNKLSFYETAKTKSDINKIESEKERTKGDNNRINLFKINN